MEGGKEGVGKLITQYRAADGWSAGDRDVRARLLEVMTYRLKSIQY